MFWLDQLWNPDKHRRIALLATVPAWGRISSIDPRSMRLYPGRVHQRKKIVQASVIWDDEPETEPIFSFDVAFVGGPASDLRGGETLLELHKFVCQAFAEILPASDLGA